MNPNGAQNSSIKRVTGITAIYHAGSVDVCRDGSKVALHINTTEGEVLVHIRERAFMRGCRGAADSNGNPFRTIEQIDEAKRREEEAASLPPPEPGAKSQAGNPRTKITGDLLAQYEEVARIHHGPHKRGDVSAACKERGIKPASFHVWLRRQKGAKRKEMPL